MGEKRTLIAYFSATGATERAAKALAKAVGGDLFAIKPVVPYTDGDLNWMDKTSRSSREMKDQSFRPPIGVKLPNMGDYDRIFLGFPIWWYVAPTIVNTFLEQYDFSGKTIILFATSGGSGFGKTLKNLKGSCPSSLNMLEGKVFSSRTTEQDLSDWVLGFQI